MYLRIENNEIHCSEIKLAMNFISSTLTKLADIKSKSQKDLFVLAYQKLVVYISQISVANPPPTTT